MDLVEAMVALKYSYYAYKDSWEQARFVALTTIKPHIKGNPKIDFPWENEVKNNPTKKTTKQDLERLQKKALNYIKTQK